jgi:hypothetical protein
MKFSLQHEKENQPTHFFIQKSRLLKKFFVERMPHTFYGQESFPITQRPHKSLTRVP